jgi:hypothetical protein
MQEATRESLLYLIFGTLMLSLGVIGLTVGLSVVPYLSGGWDSVVKTLKSEKPVETLPFVLGLIGSFFGFALGYGIARSVVLVTGIASHDYIRTVDRDLWELFRRDLRRLLGLKATNRSK